jgi:phage anti-repressor protein
MVGCQFNYSYGEDFVFANKRRHGGKEERNSDLQISLEVEESDEIDMAVRSEKGDQSNQQLSRQGRPSHGIQRGRTRFRISSAGL